MAGCFVAIASLGFEMTSGHVSFAVLSDSGTSGSIGPSVAVRVPFETGFVAGSPYWSQRIPYSIEGS